MLAQAVAGQSGKFLKIIKEQRAEEPVETERRERRQPVNKERGAPPNPVLSKTPELSLPFICVPVHLGAEGIWLMLPYFCRNRSGFMKMLHRWAFSYPLHSCSHSACVCMTHCQPFQLPRPPFSSPSICQGSSSPDHQLPPGRHNYCVGRRYASVISSGLENCGDLSLR